MPIKPWSSHNHMQTLLRAGEAEEAEIEGVTVQQAVPGSGRDVREMAAMRFPRKCPRFPFCTINSHGSSHRAQPRISSTNNNNNFWRQRPRSRNNCHRRRITGITCNCRHSTRPQWWRTRRSAPATSPYTISSNTRSNKSSTRTRSPPDQGMRIITPPAVPLAVTR